MKKNIYKLFSRSLETYMFLLIITLIIKLLGGNYFEVALENDTLLRLNDFIEKFRLVNIWYAISIYINVYVVISITCRDNSKSMKKYVLYFMPLIILIQYFKNGSLISIIVDLIYLLIIAFIRLKKFNKNNIINYVSIVVFINLVQIMSIITRNNKIAVLGGNFIINFVYNFDFILMLIIIYKLYFKRGDENLCGMVVYSGLQKLTSLRTLLKKLQRKSNNKSKEEKITNAIYIPLYILWNIFTMIVIIGIAFLNDAFIEAIFMTIAFWINKRVFGKPFHFKSVYICFAFSSVVYFVLTRITFKIGTSFFIPIFLGVALSYFTSFMVEKEYSKRLYRGMPEEDFYKLINQVTDDKLVIKMCKEFYCDRQKVVKIASENGYCIESFQKKKKKINDLIKEL